MITIMNRTSAAPPPSTRAPSAQRRGHPSTSPSPSQPSCAQSAPSPATATTAPRSRRDRAEITPRSSRDRAEIMRRFSYGSVSTSVSLSYLVLLLDLLLQLLDLPRHNLELAPHLRDLVLRDTAEIAPRSHGRDHARDRAEMTPR